MTTADDIAKHLVFDKVSGSNLISYSLKDNANGDSWKEIKLVFNGNTEPVTVNIPKADWTIIAFDGKSTRMTASAPHAAAKLKFPLPRPTSSPAPSN